MALEVAVAVVDPSKGLVALVTGVGAMGLMSHSVGFEVEGTREGAAASGERADKSVDWSRFGSSSSSTTTTTTAITTITIAVVGNGLVGETFGTRF